MPELRRVSNLYSSGRAQHPRAPQDTPRRRAPSPNHTTGYSLLDQRAKEELAAYRKLDCNTAVHTNKKDENTHTENDKKNRPYCFRHIKHAQFSSTDTPAPPAMWLVEKK